MLKHIFGVSVLTIVAFVVRFVIFLPTLDISIHDTYIVVVPQVAAFWLLLAIAAVWLVLAVSKLRHRNS